jgi:LuxR family transcriptional regulator, maltose regulon positive regulatory protein
MGPLGHVWRCAGTYGDPVTGRAASAGGWFGVPARPPAYAARPRLTQRLQDREDTRLVLVSAPAGCGKTSLVAEWIRTHDVEDVAWVTLEDAGATPWSGLVGCLETLGVDASAVAGPDGGRPLAREDLSALAAAVASAPRRVTVVMDGLDVVSGDVGRDLDLLLRHSGGRLRLVLVTRSDPVMPLYRYRLEETITELRMRDLACTDQEAGLLLEAAGVRLARDSVHALNERAHGWIVGLRFAARYLAVCESPDEAVPEVVGDTGDIAEYLLGEVLDAQPPEVRRLLLSTSVADVLRPGLIEALSGRSLTRALSLLTRDNAFIEPVPHHPGFYRYHPFFRDLLRAELAYESPTLLNELHHTASDWFADQGMLASSVAHLVAAGDWADAVRLVVDHVALGELLRSSGSQSLRARLGELPQGLPGPEAALVAATLLLTRGESGSARAELDKARREIAEDTALSSTTLALAVVGALQARNADDPARALAVAEDAERALADARPGATALPELSGLVQVSKAIALMRQGALETAREVLTTAARSGTARARGLVELECLGLLSLLACLRGELSSAAALAGRAADTADRLGIAPGERPGAAATALAWVGLERCDPGSVSDHVAVACTTSFLGGDPVTRTLLAVVAAGHQEARGSAPAGIALLEKAVAELPAADIWIADRLHLALARLRRDSGDLPGAQQEMAQVVGQDDLDAVLLRADLAGTGRVAGLERALSDAVRDEAPKHVQVNGALLQASRHLRRGDSEAARAALARSLEVAGTEVMRRPFRDAPPAVRQALARDAVLSARHRWLEAEPTWPSSRGADAPAGTPGAATAPAAAPDKRPLPATLVESLTPKELEVLEHLAQLLTTDEIAAAMFVSVNTVRTHVRSILRKLGVSRRNAAVRRARELHLLAL